MQQTAERSIDRYRLDVIKFVERRCKQRDTDTILVYLTGATDDDIAHWNKHFGSCKRRPVGRYLEFKLKEEAKSEQLNGNDDRS